MDALAYLKIKARYIASHYDDKGDWLGLPDYPHRFPDFVERDYIQQENSIKQLELWAAEHPVQTNGNAIESLIDGSGAVVYTDQESVDAVVIKIPKSWWEQEV